MDKKHCQIWQFFADLFSQLNVATLTKIWHCPYFNQGKPRENSTIKGKILEGFRYETSIKRLSDKINKNSK